MLTWDPEKRTFRLTPDGKKKLEAFKLVKGQKWILECPYSIKEVQSIDEAQAGYLDLMDDKAQVSSAFWAWLQGERGRDPKNDEEYKKILKRKEELIKDRTKAQKSIADQIAALPPDPTGAAAKKKLKDLTNLNLEKTRLEEEYNKKMQPDDQKLNQRETDIKAAADKASAHPLMAGEKNSQIPGDGKKGYKIHLQLDGGPPSTANLQTVFILNAE